jgi:exonuclease III
VRRTTAYKGDFWSVIGLVHRRKSTAIAVTFRRSCFLAVSDSVRKETGATRVGNVRGMMLRLGTLNVRSAQQGNLEGTLKGLEVLGIDICLLSETKLSDDKFTKAAFGYDVYATKAKSSSQGGVALAIKQARGKDWDTEDLQRYGPNVIGCTLVSGIKRTRVIGVYLPLQEADDASIESMVQAVTSATDPVVVLGDFNANLGESACARSRGQRYGNRNGNGNSEGERRRMAVAAAVTSLGLMDSGKGFLQKQAVGVWTWQQWRRNVRIRSSVDYILLPSTTEVRRHRIRRCPFSDTDHRMVYIDLPLQTKGKHKKYMFAFKTWPCPLPKEADRTAADKLFQACLDSRSPPKVKEADKGRPMWISEGTWRSIRLKADTRKLRPTARRRLKIRRLKKTIKKGLQNDRDRRLDTAACEIEAAMAKDTTDGYRILSRWYKRREAKGLALSHAAMSGVEEEYKKLYTRPPSPCGEMIPLVAAGRFRIRDEIPDDGEIRVAVRGLRRGKAAGPSGLSVDELKDWEDQEEDEETSPEWLQVVALVQHAFETGESPGAFDVGTLVLVPKDEAGKFRGIALLESLYKVISSIVNRRVSRAVVFHDGIHGFTKRRSCATAILETKLAMQLAKREGRMYYQVFLDLSKAYDTLDRERLYLVMEAYGMGPNILRLLKNTWADSGVVPKQEGRFGRLIPTDRGVKQGDIPSPIFFNLVIDAVIRAEESGRRRTARPDADGTGLAGQSEFSGPPPDHPDVTFYADDGRIGGSDAALVQGSLDTFTDLFSRMGLVMNASKTVAMTSAFPARLGSVHSEVYRRKLDGTGAIYKAQSQVLGACSICLKIMQMRSLARHSREQHPGAPGCRLTMDQPEPLRQGGHTFIVDMEAGLLHDCPVANCRYACTNPSIMRRHFAYRHPEDRLEVLHQPGYSQCISCGIMQNGLHKTKHLATAFCREGTLRLAALKQRRTVAAAAEAPASFTVGPKVLEQVTEFKYLGRVIAQDDSDLAACIRNIARARAKWGAISRVLRRDGASTFNFSRFYMVIVSAVLLYGSETWVVTRRIQSMLEAFHNRVARTIAGTFIRKRDGDVESWIYPAVETTLRLSHLQSLGYYLEKRRATFRDYAEARGSYARCRQSLTSAYPFPTLWEQLDNIIISESS